MPDSWLDMWNERFSQREYVYGELPNAYLEAHLKKLKPGTILFPAEGEGRNAVYAARLGWTVSAFDISIEGQKKALKLAEKNGVTIDYTIGELSTLGYKPGQFDALVLIYAHFPPAIRLTYLKTLATYVKKQGMVIFEAFSKSHLEFNTRNPKVGGPRDPDMLYSVEEIRECFPGFEVLELVETEIYLKEGDYHEGTGSVVRFFGRKK